MSADHDNEDEAPAEAAGFHKQPSSVVADSGTVIIDGPDGVAVTMSPDAAAETARRLAEAAEKARGQGENPDKTDGA